MTWFGYQKKTSFHPQTTIDRVERRTAVGGLSSSNAGCAAQSQQHLVMKFLFFPQDFWGRSSIVLSKQAASNVRAICFIFLPHWPMFTLSKLDWRTENKMFSLYIVVEKSQQQLLTNKFLLRPG